jgi:hypothetical protein
MTPSDDIDFDVRTSTPANALPAEVGSIDELLVVNPHIVVVREDARKMVKMPVLKTVSDTPPISYCVLGALACDSAVDLANGIASRRARALDALLHAQGMGIRTVFNSGDKRGWRITSCDVYAFPGFAVTEHRLAKGSCHDDKPRDGRLLAVWVFGRFLVYLPCGNERSGGAQYRRYRADKPWALGGPYRWGECILEFLKQEYVL